MWTFASVLGHALAKPPMAGQPFASGTGFDGPIARITGLGIARFGQMSYVERRPTSEGFS